MVAVVTEPAQVDPARPVALILNAGIVHRIGPARNSVAIARRLAADGVLAMRFDLSGIGDSPTRADGGSLEEHAAVDVRQAMDHLARTRGATRFVLIGLCSGADNSWMAAQDPRVVGVVLMDPVAYRTRGHTLRYYGRRVVRPGSWLTLAGRVAGRLLPAAPPRAIEWTRPVPPRDQFAAELRALIARRVRLYFIYTGAVEASYNYAGQLADGFRDVPFAGMVTCDFFADADHTFAQAHLRDRLVAAVAGWVQAHFGAQPSAAPVSAALADQSRR
jgi:dienelactone hydrolase